MGTNLEETIEALEWAVNYFIECCKPENKIEIKAKLNALCTSIKGN